MKRNGMERRVRSHSFISSGVAFVSSASSATFHRIASQESVGRMGHHHHSRHNHDLVVVHNHYLVVAVAIVVAMPTAT